MTDTNQDNLPVVAKKAQVPIVNGVLSPNDFDGLYRLANIMCNSGMVPDAYKGNVEATFVAMQMGMEVGFSHMAALQSIAVVNGKPTIYADGVTALLQGHGKLEWIKEHYEIDGEKIDPSDLPLDIGDWPNVKAVSVLKRVGQDEPYRGAFSVNDAIRIKRWNPEKFTPWKQYPGRMLMWRARTFPARDGFSDVLKGIGIFEEVIDYTDVEPTGGGKYEVPVKPGSDTEKLVSGIDAAKTKQDLAEQLDSFCYDEDLPKDPFLKWLNESATLNNQTLEETWVDFLGHKKDYLPIFIDWLKSLEEERREEIVKCVDEEITDAEKESIKELSCRGDDARNEEVPEPGSLAEAIDADESSNGEEEKDGVNTDAENEASKEAIKETLDAIGPENSGTSEKEANDGKKAITVGEAFIDVNKFSSGLTFPDTVNTMDGEAVMKSFFNYMEYVASMTKRDFQDVLERAMANPEGTAKYWCGWEMQNAMKAEDNPFQDPPKPVIKENGDSENHNPDEGKAKLPYNQITTNTVPHTPLSKGATVENQESSPKDPFPPKQTTDEGYETGTSAVTLESIGYVPNQRRDNYRIWLREVKESIPSLSPSDYKVLVDKWHRIFKGPDADSFPFPQKQVEIEFPDKNPRQALVEVRREFPEEAAAAQKFRGFGVIVSSDEAATIWMQDIKTLVEGGKLVKT
jgi:hypothetical protein